MEADILKQIRRAVRKAAGSRLDWLRAINAAPLAFRPGHFYSPITAPQELAKRYRDPRATPVPTEVAGIDLRRDRQIALWDQWTPFFPDLERFAHDEPGRRYKADSASFGLGDAIIYASMLRHVRPRRIIEVGSGASSALALDVIDAYLDQDVQLTCIEPYPDYLRAHLTAMDESRIAIIPSSVQDVPIEVFSRLESGDILFLDTTHIIKTGSDVLFEVFDILPAIKPGVLVHFHDIFYPFEYIRQWAIEQNRSWNELYLIRAFLMYNREWEIVFFNDYFYQAQRDRIGRVLPQLLTSEGRAGGGLWLRRV